MSNRNRNNGAPMERLPAPNKSTGPAGYTLKPAIRNLILFALAWGLGTNLLYISGLDEWLIHDTVLTVLACCSVILPLGSMYFVKILEDSEE